MNTNQLLPCVIEPLPDYLTSKSGIAGHQYLHIWNIPVDDLPHEPIVLEVDW